MLLPSIAGNTVDPPYARLVNRWVAMVWLDPADYGTHSLRRTKATLIYRRTKNLRAKGESRPPPDVLADAHRCR